MRIRLHTLIAGMFVITSLYAQSAVDSSTASPAVTQPESLDMGWLLLKTMGILILIIALIFVSVYLLKKYVFGGSVTTKNSDWIQILGQYQIQPKRYLALIKVLDRILLIGLTDSNIEMLSEFNDTTNIRPILEKMERKPNYQNEGRFFNLIRKNMES